MRTASPAAGQSAPPRNAAKGASVVGAPANAAHGAAAKGASPVARPRVLQPQIALALQKLANWAEGRGGTVSAEVVDLENGARWGAASPEAALNPASNMKIVTAAVALDRLGPDFHFVTGLYGKPRGGRVDPLVLRGHGDPALRTEHLWQLATAMARLGVREVGALQVDQSRFDAQFVPPAFEQQPDEWARFRAPVSAVALEGNAVTLGILPTDAGQPARAWFEPPGIVTIEGAIETRKPGSGEAVQLALGALGAEHVAKIGGHVSEGMPRMRFDRRLDDPRRAPALALRELLREVGVNVAGPVELGGRGVSERLVFHESEPLGVLVHQLGKNSDNFCAEMLFKVLGAEVSSGPATSADGARVVRQWLQARGLLAPDTRIQNGSGLFDANRISAATLIGVLEAVQRDPAIFPEFLAQLAVGGIDGTLRSRFRELKTQRRVRAKTGTLAAAVSLSGYVLDTAGRAPVAFALLVNGIEGHAWEARQYMDRVVEAIARAERPVPPQR